jgi:hypothetical protein
MDHETFIPQYHYPVIDVVVEEDHGFEPGNPRLRGDWEPRWPFIFGKIVGFRLDEAFLDMTGNLDAPL